MKKARLINGPISRIVSLMGHTDLICVADAGLPVPDGVERIDLAVHQGLPALLDVFETLTSEMCVEHAMVSDQLKEEQPDFHARLMTALDNLALAQGNTIEIDYVSHSDFKAATTNCKAVVRTGECTPYANIILRAGVTFSIDPKTA